MAHKIGRKIAARPAPAPAPFSDVTLPPRDSLAPFQPAPPSGQWTKPDPNDPLMRINRIPGGDSSTQSMMPNPYSGGMNFGGQPAQIEQAMPMPVQQGQPCPDPSAHTQQQAPRSFPGVGGFLGKAIGGIARPSMMPVPRPRPFFGGFRGLF